MVRKHFCDKCGKDIDVQSDDFDEIFESVSLGFGKKSHINQPELCKKCLKGYNKIITETNKKIESYVKE